MLGSSAVNQRQRTALAIGAAVFVVAALLLAPWELVQPTASGPMVFGPLGYAPLFSPPPPERRARTEKSGSYEPPSQFDPVVRREPASLAYSRVDRVRLVVQLLAVVVATGVAVALLGGARKT